MGKTHHPRRGSMQIWPRKRAKRSFPRIRNWQQNPQLHLSAFLGYKAGMTHILAKDNSPHTLYKNQEISIPVTIIECPPLKVLSIRFYQQTYNGLQICGEVFSKNISKEVKKYIRLPKVESKEPEKHSEVRIRVHTQPYLTGIGKRKPEVFEIKVSGKTEQEKKEYAKALLEKEIKISDLFKDQKFFDVHGVTKGKGFQGTVKRFGVPIRQHKAEKTKRGIGTLGSWHPNKVQFTVPQAGRMGYHQRVEYNKLKVLIDSDPKKINPKSGFLHYGYIKNDYVILKGSVPGPAKRAIILTPNIRSKAVQSLEIKSISLESKQ